MAESKGASRARPGIPGGRMNKKTRDYNEIELTVTRIAFFSPIILLAALWMSRIEGEARNIKKCVSSARSAPAICHQHTLIIRQRIKEGRSQEIPLLKACRPVMPSPCGSTSMAERACLMRAERDNELGLQNDRIGSYMYSYNRISFRSRLSDVACCFLSIT